LPGTIEQAPALGADRRGQRPAFALRAGLALLPGRGLVEDVTVSVADGLIREVQEGPAAARTAGPDLIDAPDATLLPGLFDSHVHLTFAAGPDPVAGLIAASDTGLAVRALQHAQLAILNQGGSHRHPFYWSPYLLISNWL